MTHDEMTSFLSKCVRQAAQRLGIPASDADEDTRAAIKDRDPSVHEGLEEYLRAYRRWFDATQDLERPGTPIDRAAVADRVMRSIIGRDDARNRLLAALQDSEPAVRPTPRDPLERLRVAGIVGDDGKLSPEYRGD